jgi:hypothetical protein
MTSFDISTQMVLIAGLAGGPIMCCKRPLSHALNSTCYAFSTIKLLGGSHMKKHLFLGALALSITAVAFSGTPNFASNNDVNYQPHPSVGNPYPVTARALGGVVFADGYDDAIFRCSNPTSTDGSTDDHSNTWNVNGEEDLSRGYASGNSFQGISYDGTAYFASGVNAASTVLLRVVDTGNDTTRWTADDTLITLSPDGAYTGVTCVGANNIVMAKETGEIQFFTVSGATATANGTAISNPNGAGYTTTQVCYYDGPTQDYIFAYMASDTESRHIDVFTTDGTPAGTAYAGHFAASLASTRPVVGQYNQKFANLAVAPGIQVLVAAVNLAPAPATGQNGFDAFDISTVATDGSATAYQTVRGGNLDSPSTVNTAGLAFFNSESNLAVTHGNHLETYNISASSTAAENWNLLY